LKSGIRPEILAELHGNHSLLKCQSCGSKFSKTDVGWDNDRHGKGYRTDPVQPGQPSCPGCQGQLMSSVVNFGDPMPEDDLSRSVRHSRECDLFLVVGSSLVVSPANHMPQYALSSGAKLILINQGETPLDDMAHLRFWEAIGQVLPPMVNRVVELIA
jgi:NAD-dependent deacetylase